MSHNQKPASTQKYLQISGIEQDLIILSSGGIRQVIRAYPINFDLKSEQEQNAIIYGYQTFLNSLQFPIQIVVRSKKLDLERYLVKLESQTKNITNNLLQIQAQDYIGFVRRLIQIANIMSKQFLVVVGYDNPVKSGGVLSNLLATRGQIQLNEARLKTFKQELGNRTGAVMAGLNSVGVRSEILNTQQLIELFYNIYNPEESMTERLAPVEELEAEVVQTGADVAQKFTVPKAPEPTAPTQTASISQKQDHQIAAKQADKEAHESPAADLASMFDDE